MVDALDRGLFMRDLNSRTIQAVYLRPQQLVTFYLMASYLYYHLNMTLMPDTEYDKVCVRLDEEWDAIEHPHKKHIDREALKATTGYHMRVEDYPQITKNSAMSLIQRRSSHE